MRQLRLPNIELDEEIPLDLANAKSLSRLATEHKATALEAFDMLQERIDRLLIQENASYGDAQRLLRMIFWHAYTNEEVVLSLIGLHCDAIRDSSAYTENQRHSLYSLTEHVFCPVLELMGMWRLRRELGDKFLGESHPRKYRKVLKLRDEIEESHSLVHTSVRKTLEKTLSEAGIADVEIRGHNTSLSGLYWKLMRRTEGEILRHYSFNILVEEQATCYLLPYYIHRLWKPLSGRSIEGISFRDLIAAPEFNGYRSLITTIAYPDNDDPDNDDPKKSISVEFRIRSRDIEQINLDGLVASRLRKDSQNPIRVAWWDDKEIKEYVSSRPLDSDTPKIFVFSPRGKIYRNLPRNSTPIDYAYRVHSDIGDHCTRIWIDGSPANFTRRLKNGQLVQLDTDPSYLSPDKKWLEYVKTSSAKRHIKRVLQQRRKPRGREIIDGILDNELQWHGIDIEPDKVQEHLEKTADKFGYLGVNALYIDVHENPKLSPDRIVHALITEELQKYIRATDPSFQLSQKIDFARCFHNRHPCRVTPGTPIVGRILNQGRALKVYRADCPNAPQGIDATPLSWRGHRIPGDIIRVSVSAVDRPRLLGDVLARIYELKTYIPLNIFGVHARVSRDRAASIDLDIETPDTCTQEKLALSLQELKQQGILDVYCIDPLSHIDRVLLALPDSLPNPYTTGPANWRLFKGREAELEQFNHYLQANENYIVVHGGNRIGKTSLLRHAKAHLIPDLNRVPVFLDMQGLPEHTEECFWIELATCIDKAYSRRVIGLKNESNNPETTAYTDFKRNLTANRQIYVNKPPVLMIDEMNVVDELWEVTEATIFVQHLLAFARQYSEINLVFSLQEDLYKEAVVRNTLPSADLLETGTRIRLGHLVDKAARRVVLDPVNSMLSFDPDVVEDIVSLTAGHPYYLQKTLFRLVERASIEKNYNVTKHWLSSVLDMVYNSEHEFHDFIRKTTGIQRTVLVALADCQASGRYPALVNEIGSILQDKGITVHLGEIEEALEHLYMSGVIERGKEKAVNVYHIDVPLFQRWLSRTQLSSLQIDSAGKDKGR